MQEGLSLMWKNLSPSVGALDRAEAELGRQFKLV